MPPFLRVRRPGSRGWLASPVTNVNHMPVQVRRIYEEPTPSDGTRVLVDRLWPRGVSKQRAALDLWLKAVSPSTELRQWYAHDPAKFDEFARRYRTELDDAEHHDALAQLRGLMSDGPLTLLTATKNPELSEAAVLASLLNNDETAC